MMKLRPGLLIWSMQWQLFIGFLVLLGRLLLSLTNSARHHNNMLHVPFGEAIVKLNTKLYSIIIPHLKERTILYLPACQRAAYLAKTMPWKRFLKGEKSFSKSEVLVQKKGQLDDVTRWWWRHCSNFSYSLNHGPNDYLSWPGSIFVQTCFILSL